MTTFVMKHNPKVRSSATSEIGGFDDYFKNFCSQMQKDLKNTLAILGLPRATRCLTPPLFLVAIAKAVTQLNLQGVVLELL